MLLRLGWVRLGYLFTEIITRIRVPVSVLAPVVYYMHIFNFSGNTIECWDKSGGNEQFGKVVNQYCWITGTYRLGDHEWHTIGSANASTNQEIVHSYYQWIPYFLILLVNITTYLTVGQKI